MKNGTVCVSSRSARSITDARRLLDDPDYTVWQARFSPDDNWICFNAVSAKRAGESVIGVMPTAGGPWIPITSANEWADKPRWAPDGRTVYFISNRGSPFFNVWGIRFDAAGRRPIGEEFRVTRYDDPAHLIAADVDAGIALSSQRLVVPITDTKGSIWILNPNTR